MDRIPIGDEAAEPDNVVRLPGALEEPTPPEEEMSYEEAIAADTPADADEAAPRPSPGSQVAGLFGQGLRVGAGLFASGASALADALRSTMPPADDETDPSRDPVATMAGAGLGVAVTAADAAADAAMKVADAAGPAFAWLVEPRFASDAGQVAGGTARVLDGQWQASQAEIVEAATSFLKVIVPEIVQGLAGQVDLTALVRERVDVNAIASDVDIERVLDRIDVDAVVARIDLNAALDRVDVDRLLERADVAAIVERLDVGAIAHEVIEDVDLPRVIRESSGALAGETVRTARVRGMHADRIVERVVDAVLRREARDLASPPPRSGPA